MSTSFDYKPRFVDIRIKAPRKAPEADVRVCDWADCVAPGAHRAPKGRDQLDAFYWFCPTHAAEYNRGWNFFEGMSDAEVEATAAAEAAHGGRPTWSMGTAARPRDAAAKAKSDWARAFADPFGLFRNKDAAPPPPRERKLGRLEKISLDALGLREDAPPAQVRQRYTELVKKLHPDANGGDRSMEAKLGQVIRAYQTLKKAGRA